MINEQDKKVRDEVLDYLYDTNFKKFPGVWAREDYYIIYNSLNFSFWKFRKNFSEFKKTLCKILCKN